MKKYEFEKMKEGVLSRLKRIPEIKAVFLFGSYAIGKEKPISDIDICVIAKKNIETARKMEIMSYAGGKIDISMFYDLPISIRASVLKDGTPLFSRDEKFIAEIMVSTMKEYLDFSHVLKKFTKLYIGG